MVRTEVVVDVAAKVFVPVEPRADTDEGAVIEPFRSIIACRSTAVRSDIVVSVRTIRSYADSDTNLCRCIWCRNCEGDAGYSRKK